jgi:hypothetical protein
MKKVVADNRKKAPALEKKQRRMLLVAVAL